MNKKCPFIVKFWDDNSDSQKTVGCATHQDAVIMVAKLRSRGVRRTDIYFREGKRLTAV